ncbi:MAG: hypothetical protein ABIG28_03100 [archaeon]
MAEEETYTFEYVPNGKEKTRSDFLELEGPEIRRFVSHKIYGDIKEDPDQRQVQRSLVNAITQRVETFLEERYDSLQPPAGVIVEAKISIGKT